MSDFCDGGPVDQKMVRITRKKDRLFFVGEHQLYTFYEIAFDNFPDKTAVKIDKYNGKPGKTSYLPFNELPKDVQVDLVKEYNIIQLEIIK